MVTIERQREVWHPASIKGERVALRHHRYEDLGAVRRWYRDPELARLTRITLRQSDQLIGSTTFSNLDPDNSSTLFHISIGEPDAWGNGFGTEATELMLWLAFERVGLHRVALSVFAFNERAIRSYEKAGFSVEGRHREAIVRDGVRYDELTMGILASEWRARQEVEG